MTSGETQTKAKSTFNDWVRLGLIYFVIKSFIVTPCRVPSGSMLPTLQVGDFPILPKMTYGWTPYSLFGGGYLPYWGMKIWDRGLPKRGDVVVFVNPKDTHQDYIKRVVGLPGDSVQMIGGVLHLNDKPIGMQLKERQVKAYDGNQTITADLYTATLPTEGGTVSYEMFKQVPFGKGSADNTPKYFVPEDHFFVMGDNPDNSGDSRYMDGLGFVHKNYLLGRPLFSYLSIDFEDIYLMRPWTWFLLPFKIRWNRSFYQKIQPTFSPSPASVTKETSRSDAAPPEPSKKEGSARMDGLK